MPLFIANSFFTLKAPLSDVNEVFSDSAFEEISILLTKLFMHVIEKEKEKEILKNFFDKNYYNSETTAGWQQKNIYPSKQKGSLGSVFLHVLQTYADILKRLRMEEKYCIAIKGKFLGHVHREMLLDLKEVSEILTKVKDLLLGLYLP